MTSNNNPINNQRYASNYSGLTNGLTDLPIPRSHSLNSNLNAATHRTNKSNKSGVSEAKLSKVRSILFKDAAKGTTITSNNNANNNKSKDEPQRPIVEGVSVD